ncbi:hypothetical protein SETIT_4G037000v2 [Setaria italica]|uniref:Uncharacterized protein n=1 Tax=Setaria italica TaxID=4555 RepID=A0A368QQG9_SETIT|nr:hypothetical protein SETIT_4G037000v2 [Setaria italica]
MGTGWSSSIYQEYSYLFEVQMDFLCFLSSKDAVRHQSMAEGRECTKYIRMIGLGLQLLALQCKNFTSLDVSYTMVSAAGFHYCRTELLLWYPLYGCD